MYQVNISSKWSVALKQTKKYTYLSCILKRHRHNYPTHRLRYMYKQVPKSWLELSWYGLAQVAWCALLEEATLSPSPPTHLLSKDTYQLKHSFSLGTWHWESNQVIKLLSEHISGHVHAHLYSTSVGTYSVHISTKHRKVRTADKRQDCVSVGLLQFILYIQYIYKYLYNYP